MQGRGRRRDKETEFGIYNHRKRVGAYSINVAEPTAFNAPSPQWSKCLDLYWWVVFEVGFGGQTNLLASYFIATRTPYRCIAYL